MAALLAAALVSVAVADPIPHAKFEVTSLPGWANLPPPLGALDLGSLTKV